MRFALRRWDVSFWDVEMQRWVVVGGRARDRRLLGEVRIRVDS